MSIADQRTLLTFEDVLLNSTTEALAFNRTYESTPAQWQVANSLGYADAGFVALPFGTNDLSTGNRKVLWWHSLYSFAFKPSFSSYWQVRLPGGKLVTFNPCTIAGGQSSCMASTTSDSLEARARLESHSNGSFTYHAVSGKRFIYAAPLVTAGSGGANDSRYFLTEIRDRLGTRTLATITYAVPAGCTATPGGNSSGVPFVNTLTNSEGLKLFFSYVNRGPALGNSNQCVLRLVRVAQNTSAGNAVEYLYYGGDAVAGRLSQVRNYLKPPADGGLYSAQSYLYPDDTGGSLRVHEGETLDPATASLVHQYYPTSNDRVQSSFIGVAGAKQSLAEAEFDAPTPVNCPSNTLCTNDSGFSTPIVFQNRNSGTGAGVVEAQYSKATQVLMAPAPSRRTTAVATLTDAGVLTSTETYEIGLTANGPYNQKVLRDSTDTVVVATAGLGPHIETTSVTTGRGSEVEVTNYQYAYLDAGQVMGPLVQLVSLEEQNSVVPTQPTSKARTHFRYDSSGRTVGVIREGYTRIANGSPQSTTWTDAQRFVGTFFLSPDTLGRPTVIQGPCLVGNASATACTGTFPLVELAYYSTSGANDKRLNTVKRYPAGSGTALTTTYSNYDVLGNAQTVVDENGVPTDYTFEANRPKTMKVNNDLTKVWNYTYDRGHLTKVQRPEGDSEVICYRRLTSTAAALASGCNSGENPSDQPTAIFRYGGGSSGGSWYEATILTYAVDGELREEAVYQAGNTTTPFRRTTRERNPLGFTTFEKTGPLPNGTVERATRQFAPDGLVTARSTPYFAAPEFCGTPGAPSELCTQFKYWNTGRLKEMTVKPLAAATDIRVCLDYDAHGNVTGVKTGCTTTGMHSYVWDDFGNVISAKLSTSDQPIRYETDARGNVIRKGLTVSGNTVELVWNYDMLNRPTEAWENGTKVSTWQYDSDPAQATNLPSGCTQPTTTPRTLGRLVWAADPVWRTWYSYDEFGRVTREARINAAGLTCSSTSELGRQQVIERSFTDNGNELTVKYPSGRTVTNSYDSTKRLSGMAMTTWNAGWSAAPGTTMASNVAWFPGGNLKSYDLVTRPTLGGAPSTVTVSYRYGSTGNLPTDEIPSATCTTAEVDANGMGDSSGRLRAMYVTRGSTNMLRIFYRWRGEQLIEQSRCYLTSTTPEWEHFVDRTGADPAFQYDRAGRLGGGRLPNFGTTGGYCERRAYSYDTRGNRTQEKVYYGVGTDSYFSDSSRPDQLSATVYNNGSTSNPLLGWARDSNGVQSVGVYSGRNRSYEYDSLGREKYVTGTNGSSNWNMTFNGAFTGGAPVTGSESVLRAANLWDVQGGNQSFNYYYDTQNRRVRKQYPNGDLEGYFWDADKRLLMETAPETVGSVRQAMDEYLWLGQRPVLMLRSTYNISGNSWQRDRADWDSGSCLRRGAATECRPYGIVSDVLAKPVMTVDSVNRISGVLEYEPYGFTNRYSYWTDLSPAPDGCWWVAYGLNQGSSPLSRQMRMHLPRVEVGAPACLYQYVGGVQTDTACGQKWNYWTPWRDVPNGSSMDLVYCSNGTTPNPQPFGVTTDVYEYKEFEAGATPYTPPFRFPGQYFDAETDLHENWNRYYDPSTGRYLSPEPLLQEPKWVTSELKAGQQVPVYSYARNNPARNVDPDGRMAYAQWCPPVMGIQRGFSWGPHSVHVGHATFVRTPGSVSFNTTGNFVGSDSACDDLGVARALDITVVPAASLATDCWASLIEEIRIACEAERRRGRSRSPPTMGLACTP